jgi:hypothetical protein
VNTGNQPDQPQQADQNQHPFVALALFWLFLFSAVYAALWMFHG